MTFQRLILCLTLLIFSSFACSELEDSVEEALDGEVTELKEAELPNCSKVITCCDNIANRNLSDEVTSACDSQFKPAANLVIENYQLARDGIQDNTNNNGETLDGLRTTTQENFEPGCRCFLEETVGQINTDAVDLLPKDCEVDTTTGALDDGNMCSDATDTLLNAATSSGE